MGWLAVIDDATGELISVGTVVGALRPGLVTLPIPDAPGDRLWNRTTRTFDDRPPVVLVDRVLDFVDGPDFKPAYDSMTVARKTATRTALASWLGSARWRLPTEPTVVRE